MVPFLRFEGGGLSVGSIVCRFSGWVSSNHQPGAPRPPHSLFFQVLPPFSIQMNAC